jgi:hypothetical protein
MSTDDFPERLVEIDSELAKEIDFTFDKFVEHGEIGSQLSSRMIACISRPSKSMEICGGAGTLTPF